MPGLQSETPLIPSRFLLKKKKKLKIIPQSRKYLPKKIKKKKKKIYIYTYTYIRFEFEP